MKKVWISLFAVLLALFILIYRYLGIFLDVSEQPRQADIIVILGGGWDGWRIKKGLYLFKHGYSQSTKILINPWNEIHIIEKNTPYQEETKFLLAHGVKKDNIVYFHSRGKTYYELEAIKKYLLNHRYHSLIIVTDPPHTRRVRLLMNYLLHYNQAGLKVFLVSSDAPWWSKENYYKNETAKDFAFQELMKLPYNIVVYGIFERYHIIDFLRKIYHFLKETTSLSAHPTTILKIAKCFDSATFRIV